MISLLASICAICHLVFNNADVHRVMAQDVVYFTPEYAMDLEEAQPDAGLDALERGGLIRKVRVDPRTDRALYVLTERGAGTAARMGWDTEFNTLVVPLGTLVPIEGSQHVFDMDSRSFRVGFRARFRANASARFMRALPGGAKTEFEGFLDRPLTLADDGKEFSETAIGFCASMLHCNAITSSFSGVEAPSVRSPHFAPYHSRMTLDEAIHRYLSERPPVVGGGLDEAEDTPTVRNFERAGLLRRTAAYQTSCGDPRIMLAMTEQGAAQAKARAWGIRYGMYEIPVGRLAYVPGSAHVRYTHGEPSNVAFRTRFEGNNNASYLRRLADPSTWRVHLGRRTLTLADVGKTFVKRLPVYDSPRDGWYIDGEPLFGPAFTC